ncbi:exodeoxyribonuclease III [Haliangium sp.]|uniref:exodeoxyribonuclease III n=1 Tax=Haliangium sp. TaxID=2663208 RepID=UPI003D0A2401
MRIATWNINGMRARLDYLKLWLRAREPDVVGLQELKSTDEQFPHDELAALGYHAITHGQKAWNGVAILSRTPATLTQTGLPGQEDLGARLISAEVAGLSFTTVYCPNGKSIDHADFGRKLAWFDALVDHVGEHLARDAARAAVLCGDFNICPAAIDSWAAEAMDGRIFHTEAERARFRRVLDSGLIDLFRARYPDQRAYSWWDYRGGAFHKKQGLRIDFVLATAAVHERVREVEIDRDFRKKQDGLTASDHAPVMVELDWPHDSAGSA